MSITYKTGDALKGPENYFCHGCNSRGVQGSGVALQVKTDYPEAFAGYRKIFEELDRPQDGLQLGRIIPVKCRDGRTIIHAITQQDYGRDPNKVYVSYDAIEQAIASINAMAVVSKASDTIGLVEPIEAVAFPTIGAGLANGSWRRISGIIEAGARDFEPVVYLFDGRMPTS